MDTSNQSSTQINESFKHNSIFIVLLVCFILFTVFYKGYQYFILENYKIVVTIPCDPLLEKCLVDECEDCSVNEEYKELVLSADSAPECNSPSDCNELLLK